MRLSVIVSLFLVAAASAATWAAPVPYAGGTYTQDFDGLPASGSTTVLGTGPHDIQGQLGSTGVAGWTMSNYAGSSADTEFRAQDGSQSGSAGRGVLSLGASASTERALGQLPTSNQVSRFGVAFVNNTGATLTQFSLGFIGEQWRRGDVTTPAPGQNALSYDYAITSNPADTINTAGIFSNLGSFSSPTTTGTNVALDGNLPANQVPVSLVKNNISWAPNSFLLLRWSGIDATGQDDALAIDTLRFSAVVPEPAAAMLTLIAGFGLLALRRRQGN